VRTTFLISYLGFLSASATPIELVREFGLVASSGLSISFLLTVLLLPAYLARFGEKTGARKPAAAPTERQCGGVLETAVAAMVRSLLARRPLVLAVAVSVWQAMRPWTCGSTRAS
jgi:predicted RND superfamily exporter protein